MGTSAKNNTSRPPRWHQNARSTTTEVIHDIQTSDARQSRGTGQELYLLRNGDTPPHRWCSSVSVLREGTPSRDEIYPIANRLHRQQSQIRFPLEVVPQQLSSIDAAREAMDDSMTLEEYERLYAEALDVVRTKIGRVGEPDTALTGRRLLHVGPILCNDEMVFRLAWGKEAARDIVAQRRSSRG